MLVSERVRRSVGFVGRWEGGDNGRFIPYGTAFLAACVTSGKLFTHLITAQHVIRKIQEHTDRVVWRFNQKNGEQAFGEMPFRGWYFHPDATRYVDVAVAPVKLPDVADYVLVVLDREAATEDVVRKESIGPGDDVFMVGFFRYHWGSQKNVPIVRIGNIAAMPEEPIKTKQGPINGYLIEARSIGGLSGSPVFVHMPPWRVVEGRVRKNEGLTHYLLGIMHGHYDVVLDEDTTEEDALNNEKMNVGIGIVVPVQEILETVMQPELEDKRKEIVANLEEDGQNVTEDVEEEESDAKRDEILKTMLDTPPSLQT